MPEESEGKVHHHYYFGEPTAAILGGVRGAIGGVRVATYCDCSTCACGACACNCSCNACGACYCDCSCSGGGIARFDQAAIAAIIESLQVQLGEIRQIASSMKERK